ncbi:hypothetical protein GRJ2_002687300 [Grus japonensis]|uniref:Ubiquitin carboxyl-terminal hydrolase 36 n=1 Tax=Grus japonensis TaxID=30415 RepID=A0ABC9XXU6_GRUJA
MGPVASWESIEGGRLLYGVLHGELQELLKDLSTDSWMVANALWGWLQQWKRSNWQRRGKPIWAAPLWQEIAARLEKLVVKVRHVDAHVPKSWATEEHQNNQQVDQAAKIEVAQVDLDWQRKGELFIARWAHDTSGLQGRDATYRWARDRGVDLSMDAISQVIHQCETCAVIKQAKPVKPLWYGGRWLKYKYGEAWQIDYVTLPQSRQGKRYVLTMVEATTGWLETYPVPHATARNTILGLEKQVLWRHGTPERIESDNGTHFQNNLIDPWAKEHGIEWVYHIPYHAPASGKIERILFPPEMVCMEWRQRQRAGAGLHNLDNTCFLNSILQCLTYTPPLANYLLSGEHSQACRERGFCMMCIMEAHVNKVLRSSGSAIEPLAVISVLPLIGEHFELGMQEDAHEFLRYTVDAMQRACLSGSSECDKRVAASKRFTVHRPPKVLTLCLKRFDHFIGEKINKLVKYPEYLDLRPYMSEAAGEPLLYSLYAVVVHSGVSCGSGHYFCYAKRELLRLWKMPSYFRKIIPYAIPGVLALLGCWWIYSHRKKQASSSDKQESVAAEEEQQQEAPEEDSPPKEEAGVPMREAVSEEEEHPENETSTSLPSAESTTPSLPCQTHERPDLSEDHPDLSVTTLQPSTVAEDTAKPEATGPPDESSGPACVSLPLTSECQGSAAVSLVEDSSSGANPDQCAAGLAVKGMAFVDNDCATRKAVTHQHAHPEGGSCKSDFTIWEIEVPKALVGRLIGRKGRFMNYLKEASGAKVYVTTLPYFRDSQVCHIEGSAQQVEKVLSLIGQKFTKLCLTNIYALPPPTPLTLHSLLMTAWVTNYDNATGLPLIQLWNLVGDEAVSVNRALVERGLAQWLVY